MAIGGKGRGIQIVVGAEYTDKDLKRAQRDLDNLKRQTQGNVGPMKKLGATIKSSLGPAMAVAAAAAGALAIKLGVDGVKAAIEDEKTVRTLANTVRQLGLAHEQSGIEDFISQMEYATGVADEQLRPAMGLLLAATGDVQEAQKRLAQAMDVSAFTGRDLDSVTRAFARSLATQQSGTLSRYGIIMDKTAIKTMGFAAALDEALAPSAGAMTAQVESLGGQMQRLETQAGNVLEAFGYGFISGFDDATGSVNDVAGAMVDLQPIVSELGRQIGEVIQGLGDMAPVLLPLSKGLTDITGPTTDVLRAILMTTQEGTPPMEALAEAFGLAAEKADDFTRKVGGDTFGGGDWVTQTGDFADEMERLGDETEDAIDLLADFDALLSQRSAIRNYEGAVDDLRKSIRENGRSFDDNTRKGRENLDALDDVFQSALRVASGQESAAGKADIMRDAMSEAQTVLSQMGLTEAQQRLLLDPFIKAQFEIEGAYIKADQLRRELGYIPTDIDVNVNIKLNETWARRAAGGTGYTPPRSQYEPLIMPNSTADQPLDPGPPIGRRSLNTFDFGSVMGQAMSDIPGPSREGVTGMGGGGLVVHNLNVTSAPDERAEDSVPRALRKLAFVAGM